MTVRLKTLLTIGSAALTVIAALYVLSDSIILGRFLALERLDAETATGEIRVSLSEDIERLDRANIDLSIYDGTYKSMPRPSKAYLDSILGDGRNGWLDQQGVNFIVFVDKEAHVVAASGLDLTTKASLEIPAELRSHIAANDALISIAGRGSIFLSPSQE